MLNKKEEPGRRPECTEKNSSSSSKTNKQTKGQVKSKQSNEEDKMFFKIA